ncbi:MAG: restriction endonuclease [Beijerinckiaceae bacterium]
MSIPDYQSLMLPVLSASLGGEIRIGELVEKLAEKLGLTLEERAELLPSGKQTIFSNRVHWAKTYLTKAGLLEGTRRGYFKLTPRGTEVLESKPARIDVKFLSQFNEFQEFRERSTLPQGAAEDQNPAAPVSARQLTAEPPNEIMLAAHRQIEPALAQDLLDRIRSAPPDFFERLIVNLLLSMGFGGSSAEAGRALGRSGDDGVDGVIDQDALGLGRIYIQAKRYALGNNNGPKSIREFFGSLDLHKVTKGLFVTASTFSASATKTAESLGKRIVLIDGEQLAELRFHIAAASTLSLSGTACINVSAMLSSGLLSASRTTISARSNGRSTAGRLGGKTAKTLFPTAFAAPASNQTLFRVGSLVDGIRRTSADARSISWRSTLGHRSLGFTSDSDSLNTEMPRCDIKLASSFASFLFSDAYERNTCFMLDICCVLHPSGKFTERSVEIIDIYHIRWREYR